MPNGTWATTPDYGPVWTPTSVPAGWAPYRYGQWTWIAPWGWTWVDSAPWGFAPFHYGRWVYYGGGWGWSPGPLGYWNPYYAPALVGWIGGPGFGIGFGWGGGWGFGIGIGFGWYPLGWGAPYYPRYCGWGHGGWYHGGGYVTAGYFHNVNVTNTHITNINNAANNYHNGNFGNTNSIARNGVTSASKAAFTSGAAVNKVGGAVPASALNNAHTLSSANVNPTKSSVLGGQTPRTQRSVCGVSQSLSCDASDASGAAGQLQQRAVSDGAQQLELHSGDTALRMWEHPRMQRTTASTERTPARITPRPSADLSAVQTAPKLRLAAVCQQSGKQCPASAVSRRIEQPRLQQRDAVTQRAAPAEPAMTALPGRTATRQTLASTTLRRPIIDW